MTCGEYVGKQKSQTPVLQVFDFQKSAHDWTRTSTSLGNHPLKMACLPISPRGQYQINLEEQI
jgi:hypothetical protein